MTRRIAVSIFLLAIATVTFAGDSHHMANAPSSPAFDKMKALVGEWKANVPPVGDVTATYSLHSDGSALVEELKMPDNASMVTVYYPTKDGVAMTHYCSGHNQPHMVTKGTGAGNVSFSEVSVDNLPTKGAAHMSAVDFAFKDADHFTATWTHSEAGKNMPMAFVFTRAH
jgi:hypothetical protein